MFNVSEFLTEDRAIQPRHNITSTENSKTIHRQLMNYPYHFRFEFVDRFLLCELQLL